MYIYIKNFRLKARSRPESYQDFNHKSYCQQRSYSENEPLSKILPNTC